MISYTLAVLLGLKILGYVPAIVPWSVLSPLQRGGGRVSSWHQSALAHNASLSTLEDALAWSLGHGAWEQPCPADAVG